MGPGEWSPGEPFELEPDFASLPRTPSDDEASLAPTTSQLAARLKDKTDEASMLESKLRVLAEKVSLP